MRMVRMCEARFWDTIQQFAGMNVVIEGMNIENIGKAIKS